MTTDHDHPWKEALDVFLRAFLQLLFPEVEAAVDWGRGFERLEQALTRITARGGSSPNHVDKLYRVWRKDGREQWLLIHVEVQSQPEAEFPRRMFVYFARLLDEYGVAPLSLAVLADGRPDWRPGRFAAGEFGCAVRFDFPAVKLLDYADRGEELARSANPFAAVVEFHLETLATAGDPPARAARKLAWVRRLKARGWPRRQATDLFRLLDWFLQLPPELDRRWWDDVETLKREMGMPFITTPERYGHERGLKQGLEQGEINGLRKVLKAQLVVKFGPAGKKLHRAVNGLSAEAQLMRVLKALPDATSAEELRALFD